MSSATITPVQHRISLPVLALSLLLTFAVGLSVGLVAPALRPGPAAPAATTPHVQGVAVNSMSDAAYAVIWVPVNLAAFQGVSADNMSDAAYAATMIRASEDVVRGVAVNNMSDAAYAVTWGDR